MFVLCYLFWNLIFHAESCSVGLTQLRYPKTLSVMRCAPPENGAVDPCRGLAGDKEAYCENDAGGEFVCCGPTELLLEILSSNVTVSPLRRLQDTSLLQRSSPPPFLRVFSNGIDPNFLFSSNSRRTDLTDGYGSKGQFFDSTTRPTANAVPPRPIVPNFTNNHYLQNNQIVEIQSATDDGPTVTLLTTGSFDSYSSRSTIVLVEDGNCRVVINTGLPGQEVELRSSLSSKGLLEKMIDYTVVTSTLPQFIGNLNIFKSKKYLVGSLEVQGDTVSEIILPMNLCSQKIELVATPGATSDGTTVLLKNVRGMGTVAVTGALFLEDDGLSRTDPLFTSDHNQLITSRRTVICQADWLVPGHSGPIPISEQAKIDAGC